MADRVSRVLVVLVAMLFVLVAGLGYQSTQTSDHIENVGTDVSDLRAAVGDLEDAVIEIRDVARRVGDGGGEVSPELAEVFRQIRAIYDAVVVEP